MYATGQFPALLETGLPLEGLQFALLMYALLSVIFIGLSIRMNFALTCLFTVICLAYFCLGIGQTRSERVVKVSGHSAFPLLGQDIAVEVLQEARLQASRSHAVLVFSLSV